MKGDLPLHLALKSRASSNVVKQLLTAFPQAIALEDNFSKSCLQIAVKVKASVGVFELLKDCHYDGSFFTLALETTIFNVIFI